MLSINNIEIHELSLLGELRWVGFWTTAMTASKINIADCSLDSFTEKMPKVPNSVLSLKLTSEALLCMVV